MKCKKCKEKFPANINEPAPGGSNSPGVFFVFNALLILAGFLFIALGWKIWFIIAVIALLLGIIANIFTYIGFLLDNGIKGVSCPKCSQKNMVYPWSF
jgi:hypothetical protein